MRSLFKAAVILFLLLTNEIVLAKSKSEKIDEFLQLYYENGALNGIVLVANSGKVIFKKGYGFANFDKTVENTPSTKYNIASITKQFTATLIMKLASEGKINLNAPITKYLTDYRSDNGSKVTIHHLLSHTSGIPNYTSNPDFAKVYTNNPYSNTEFIKMFCSGDLEFTPGSKFSYSNTGYFLLGAIIEKTTGKSYESALNSYIFEPLKMTHSGLEGKEILIKTKANGYSKLLRSVRPATKWDMSAAYSAGGIYSTVEDLYKWDRALYEDSFIADEIASKLYKPVLSDYGYGWRTRKIKLHDTNEEIKAVFHTGSLPGIQTRIIRLPRDQHLIVLMNNTGGTYQHDMVNGITNILYDSPYKVPPKALSKMLLSFIDKSGIDAAIKSYYQVKNDSFEDYDFHESTLNSFGYQLLQAGMVEEAVKIFELNTLEYPKSSNVYDSFGEGLMKAGQKAAALKNYRKSLKLNPNNHNAAEIIKREGASE